MLRYLHRKIGQWLARYLTEPLDSYHEFAAVNPALLRQCLKPCDILLVEGNSRISTAIKYLTQSTWSHACIYLGDDDERPLVEADLVEGVIRVSLEKYRGRNLRICRPVRLREDDAGQIVEFMRNRIGYTYDLKNITDLMRYLIQKPPVPDRYRRQLIELGSGDPTKAICSTLIAQAFQSIHYPILPREISICQGEQCSDSDTRILEARHYSNFTPRDFDLSPYFAVVKPTLERGFDYQRMRWLQDDDVPLPAPPAGTAIDDRAQSA